jgi:hypothetical protein
MVDIKGRRFACVIAITTICLLGRGLALAQVIHTPHDHVPNFAATPTIQSVADGGWSVPSTWTPARLPQPGDIVRVAHTVTYDSITGDVEVIGIDSGGTLRFAINQTTRLRVSTLLVLPNGTLEVGTASGPVAASVTAEIIIKDTPLNPSTDPDQYGTGLLSIDGTVTLHGAIKSPTFVRTASEPRAGQTTLSLGQAVAGWLVGDRVFCQTRGKCPQSIGSTPITRCRSKNERFRTSAPMGERLRCLQRSASIIAAPETPTGRPRSWVTYRSCLTWAT